MQISMVDKLLKDARDARERLLRVYLLGGGLLTLALSLAFLGAGHTWVGVLGSAGAILCIATARWVGRALTCRLAFIGSNGLMLANLVMVFSTGGLGSPFVASFTFIPSMAVLLGGTAAAVPTAAVATMHLCILGMGHYLGWPQPEESWFAGLEWVTLMLTMGLLSASSWWARRSWYTTLEGLQSASRALSREVTGHKRTQSDLKRTYDQMLVAARRAGMGEVATGILHNAGNALNAVTTSVGVSIAGARRPAPDWKRVADLLRTPDLDPNRLVLLGNYIEKLEEQDHSIRKTTLKELERIRDAAEHLAAIVQAQQQLACGGTMVEPIAVHDVVEQARLLTDTGMGRDGIEYSSAVPSDLTCTVDRHRLVQILTNLLGNARDALRQYAGDRSIVVRAQEQEDIIIVDVVDSGPGLPFDDVDVVFSHGFTTKIDGHGFGLHSSALAAKELGGELTVMPSAVGAHFRLRFPRVPSADGPRGIAPTLPPWHEDA